MPTQMPTNPDVVVFRTYKDGDVIALFPGITEGIGYCLSYMHIGQHSAASYGMVLQETRLATEEEYASLKQELEGIGYNLKVQKRKSA